MNRKLLFSVLGLTSVITFNIVLPANSESKVYTKLGGKESLNLDADTLEILEDIGLTFTGAESTTTPAPGFSIGAALLPPSSTPGVRGTNSTFLYDPDSSLYLPLTEDEEFSGSFSFRVDTDKLNGLGEELVVGDFSLGIDELAPNFKTEIVDTITTDMPFLDIVLPGTPTVDLESQTWELDGVQLFLSDEFNDFLEAAGADSSVAGLKFADSRADRSFVEVPDSPPDDVSVAEPGNILALLLTVIFPIGIQKLKNKWSMHN